MLLLEDAELELRRLVRAADEDAAVKLFRRVVYERTDAMHQRAQAAESRAFKAERDFRKFVRVASLEPK